jgi:pimeloyl-ACP methyl ester carboxylesterase
VRLDVSIHEGRATGPLVVFVHGLGMNRLIWTEPFSARVMGGLFPLKSLLKGYDISGTLYHDLRKEGCSVAAWSQRRPVGPAGEAVKEMALVMEELRKVKHKGVVLIGHSRGGLVARKFMELHPGELKDLGIKAVVTLSTPHGGSDLAKWAVFLSPLAAALKPFVPEAEHGRLSSAMRRTLSFLESRGVKELLPGSEFLSSFVDKGPEGVYCLSAGGTDPALVRVPGVMPLPESLERLLPESVLPEEMRRGKGDGLVSARSAKLPFAREHMDFFVNHAAMAVDRGVRRAVLERLHAQAGVL